MSSTSCTTSQAARANLVLTLATLDVSFGGDHLATWATDAVAVITAGRSSWTTISAVGEMIRLSGTRLVSAVLIGADQSDESLGLTYTPGSHEVEARHRIGIPTLDHRRSKQPRPPAREPERPDWAHPALTGLDAWTQMISALEIPYQAQRDAELYIRRSELLTSGL